MERGKKVGATGAMVRLPLGISGLDGCIERGEWLSREIAPEFEE